MALRFYKIQLCTGLSHGIFDRMSLAYHEEIQRVVAFKLTANQSDRVDVGDVQRFTDVLLSVVSDEDATRKLFP